MKLSQLSAVTGTPVSSIKYYLRAGLLRPGEKRNQTTASYGPSHVARLELIAGLRHILDSPVGEIGQLTALLDDPATPILTILEAAQTLGSGLSPGERRQPEDTGPGRSRVTELMRQRQWPDRDSVARSAVERVLRDMAELGLSPSSGYLEQVTAAVDDISRIDLDITVEGDSGPGWRDRLALRVAVGTHQYSRLVLALLRLGQTSHSIRRFGESGGGGRV